GRRRRRCHRGRRCSRWWPRSPRVRRSRRAPRPRARRSASSSASGSCLLSPRSAAQRGDGVVAAGSVAQRVGGVGGNGGVRGVVLLPQPVPLAAVPGGGEELLEVDVAGAELDDVVAVAAGGV